MPSALPNRPIDATLSVTKAARLLGVHPNTVRAWSDAGRLRYYRINPRGDRRYRQSDLQRFLAAAESGPEPGGPAAAPLHGAPRRGGASIDRAGDGHVGSPPAGPSADGAHHRADLATVAALGRIAADPETLDEVLREAAQIVRQRGAFRTVALYELRGERFVPRAAAPANRLPDLPRSYGALGHAIDRALAGEAGPVESDGHGGFIEPADGLPEVAIAIPGVARPWGVLVALVDPASDRTALDPELLVEVSAGIGLIVAAARRAEQERTKRRLGVGLIASRSAALAVGRAMETCRFGRSRGHGAGRGRRPLVDNRTCANAIG